MGNLRSRTSRRRLLFWLNLTTSATARRARDAEMTKTTKQEIGSRTKSLVGISRRDALKTGAGAAALMAAVRMNFPGGAFAQGAGPEVTKATLGFIALTDAAPLFVAKEKGIFAKYGMPDVEVAKQASWGARATISCSAVKATASTARIF